MGTDYEAVLEDLKAFASHLKYWFECTGKADVHLISQVEDLEQALLEYKEKLR